MEKLFINQSDLMPSAQSNIFYYSNHTRIVKTLSFDEYKNVKQTLDFLEIYKHLLPEIAFYDLEGQTSNGDFFISRPYHIGHNIKYFLANPNILSNVKIEILKKLGLVLTKIDELFDELGICFGDVHEGNFLYNGNVIPIDIESISTKELPTSASPYLYLSPNINTLQKYKSTVTGQIFATPDTDYFSLIMICLKVISNSEHILSIDSETYYKYLNYLESLGFNQKLLESFASIYAQSPTINPTPYLNTIPLNLEKASFTNFLRKL